MGAKKKRTKQRETNDIQCNKNHSPSEKLDIYCPFPEIQLQGYYGNHNSQEENCPFNNFMEEKKLC